MKEMGEREREVGEKNVGEKIALAEKQYCKVKEKLEQESTTIDEESFEIDHEADSTVRTYMNRRGRAVKRHNYLDHYYI